MQAIRIVLDVDADPPLKGLDLTKTIRIRDGIVFSRIPKGTQSGRSAVGITAALPGGGAVFIELTMANFEGVAAAFRGAEARARECDGRN